MCTEQGLNYYTQEELVGMLTQEQNVTLTLNQLHALENNIADLLQVRPKLQNEGLQIMIADWLSQAIKRFADHEFIAGYDYTNCEPQVVTINGAYDLTIQYLESEQLAILLTNDDEFFVVGYHKWYRLFGLFDKRNIPSIPESFINIEMSQHADIDDLLNLYQYLLSYWIPENFDLPKYATRPDIAKEN